MDHDLFSHRDGVPHGPHARLGRHLERVEDPHYDHHLGRVRLSFAVPNRHLRARAISQKGMHINGGLRLGFVEVRFGVRIVH